MYKLCRTEQSAARQRQLEQGLLQAMRTQQYEDISISDLCDQMGIPRKSFYRYFSNKDGALFAPLQFFGVASESRGILVFSCCARRNEKGKFTDWLKCDTINYHKKKPGVLK